MASWLVAHGFRDFYIVNPEGNITAGMRQADEGKAVSAELSGKLVEVLHGEALLTHPLSDGNDQRMWLLTPLYNQAGKAVGVFALVLREGCHFAQVARLGRYGHTVETYLVDRQGRLLTPSRFEDELVASGRLKPGHSSVLAVRAVQPGTDEPTLAVAHMLDARQGGMLKGMSVISERWLSESGSGIVCMMRRLLQRLIWRRRWGGISGPVICSCCC